MFHLSRTVEAARVSQTEEAGVLEPGFCVSMISPPQEEIDEVLARLFIPGGVR